MIEWDDAVDDTNDERLEAWGRKMADPEAYRFKFRPVNEHDPSQPGGHRMEVVSPGGNASSVFRFTYMELIDLYESVDAYLWTCNGR